jgi:lipopolysaccharide/colanic/teichoic acid biosynthesis glycosyltransferase
MTPNSNPSRARSEAATLASAAPGDGVDAGANPAPIRGLRSLARTRPEPSGEPRLLSLPATRTVSVLYRPVKRVIDFFVGAILLIFATPIILIAAAAIRIETRGSPFFVQTRIGKGGKTFKIVKLRGMFIDAPVRFASYYDYSEKKNLDFFFHHEDDPRVTRAGRLIRKTSIDELPNLWNVVLGDMSLVGPRPEIPEVINLYGSFREEYLSVKPGVTCLSKITGRDRLTKQETIEFDISYIRQRCLGLDISILWRTFRSVLLRRDVF